MPQKPNPDYVNPSKVCKSCGRPVVKCHECGKTYYPMRSDSETCSDACRLARHRRLAKLRAAEALEEAGR